MLKNVVRGPLLIPAENGSVTFHSDGVLASNDHGSIQIAGRWSEIPAQHSSVPVRQSHGIMMPPLLDIHTHIPQHPIRGRFVEGIADQASEGKLLAGLNRNVFPAEAKCSDAECADKVVRAFLADTLSHGVVGGATYMTPSVVATEIALSILPESWSVGLVLMNQNCPENLRTDEPALEPDVERLAKTYGRRLIVTDRFAVAVNSQLRHRASALAEKFGLRTQTHLNEQIAEKAFVQKKLYPGYASYTDVYHRDGLLDHRCIAAHCIQMTEDEWHILRDTNSTIAHCPTSNFLLGSGVMSLEDVSRLKIPYAIATDVGASPTVSMLAEMKRFVQMHREKSDIATAVEALYRATRAPADLLGMSSQFGRLERGSPMSFIEVKFAANPNDLSAEDAIRSILPENMDYPTPSVHRVTISGRTVFERDGQHA